jgi:hypothetical protein
MTFWPFLAALTRLFVHAAITITVHVFDMLGLLYNAFELGFDILAASMG